MKKRRAPVTCRYPLRVLSFVRSGLARPGVRSGLVWPGVRAGFVSQLPAGEDFEYLGVLFMRATINPTCLKSAVLARSAAIFACFALLLAGGILPIPAYGQAAAPAAS